MRTWCIFAAASILVFAAAAHSTDIEVRFCPAASVWMYPLSDQRGFNSLLLQNFAVVNRGTTPLTITDIDVQLLDGDTVLDEKHIVGTALTRVAKASPAIEQALQHFPFQFCGSDMIAPGVTLGGSTLKASEALLVMWQAFAFNGPRDTLRVIAHAGSIQASANLPIRSGTAENKYHFPLQGSWTILNGPSFHSAHRWSPPEQFAYDVAKVDPNGRTHTGDGTKFSDYFAYGAEVLAAADGRVVAERDGISDDVSAMRQPTETQEAYLARMLQEQDRQLDQGTVAGNYVIIDHGHGEFSLSAHLKPGSVRVKAGEIVKAGQVIGLIGSSGNSTEPHLHFQVCDKPNPLMCAGIPAQFTNIRNVPSEYPRAIQTGDLVITK